MMEKSLRLSQTLWELQPDIPRGYIYKVSEHLFKKETINNFNITELAWLLWEMTE